MSSQTGGPAVYQGPNQYVDITFRTQGANVGSTKRLHIYETGAI